MGTSIVPTWIEAHPTPIEFDGAAACLRNALRNEIGSLPSRATLALALAKTALETGRWQKMFGWSWGNIKAAAGYAGMYQCYPCNEVLGGQVVWFHPLGKLSGKGGYVVGENYGLPPGHPQTRFRAYANAYDGAYDYVSFQARELNRFRAAWMLLLAGNVEGYVRALSAAGYFTAPVETYLATVSKLHAEFLARLGNAPADEVPVSDRWDWQADAVRSVGQRFDDIGIIRAGGLADMSADPDEETKPA
jgi:hypothetical protein